MKKELGKYETVRFLESCDWRKHPEEEGWVQVLWQGHWLTLCRTDWADDVATGGAARGSPDELFAYFVKMARARKEVFLPAGGIMPSARVMIDEPAHGIIRHPDGREEQVTETASYFAIIDAFSDG